MLAKIIRNIEEAEVLFSQAVFGFLGIISIRFFLENLSSHSQSFPAVPDVLTLVHYALFYAGAFLSSVLLVRAFVPDIKKISKVILSLLPVMWLPPIIDLILSRGAGYQMAYIFATGKVFWMDFLTLGGVPLFGGVTPGIKIEMAIILFGLAAYVFLKTKSIPRAVIIAVLGYCLVFAWLAFPSIIAAFGSLTGAQFASVPGYFLIGQVAASHFAVRAILPPGTISYSVVPGMFFNAGISYLFYLLDSMLIIGWALLYRPHFLKEYLRNCRPERVTSFFFMIAVGFFVAIKIEHAQPFGNWIDVMAFVVLFLAYFCAWIFAVGVNDIVDIEIDRVSNQDRPLVTSTVTEEEVHSANIFFLLWSFIGAFLVGYWAVFAMMLFTAAYYIYSAPPLRLKRVPLLATFFIALASLSATAAGFYFASPDQLAIEFPGRLLLLVIIFFTLITNVKDIKDIDGDRAAGIATIPTMFSEGIGKTVVGAIVVIAFLSVPAILASAALFIPSLIAAGVGYYFVIAEPYHERRIFVLYFIYAIVVGIILSR